MIELDGITVSLPPRRPLARKILDHVSLTIEKGEWVALVGPNGSGKSTLLKTLAGACPLAAGRLRIGPERPKSDFLRAVPDSERTPVGLLLQEPDNQFVANTVSHELLLSLDQDQAGEKRGERLAGAIDRFSLGPLLGRNPHRISGGEKQRLALATVWLSDPEVLLLDEPTSYLDRVEREQCVSFVRELNRSGVTVVWATPGGDELREASRVVYLIEGKVGFDGPPEGFEREAREKGMDVLLPDAETVTPKAKSPPSSGPRIASVTSVVTMRNLSFAYDDIDVLHEVTGDIRSGEAIGIAGRVGSGKSTFLSLVGGVLEPSSGTIERRFTRPVEEKDGRREQAVFYLFQNPERLFFAETVFEEVVFGLKSLGVARLELRDRVEDALSRVALEPKIFLDRSPFSLSLGEMRRLAFAVALALQPRLLLLDEPTSCLDARGRKILGDVIDLLRSGGTTVVAASHDPVVLHRMMDRCWTIDDGRLWM